VGDMSLSALAASQKFVLDRYPDVKPLRKSLQVLVDNVKDVFHTVRNLIKIVYSVLFAIMLIIISAPPLLRIATITHSSKYISIASYLLYLLIPTLLSWLLIGILSSIGAVVSDVCRSLHDYRTFLNISTLSNINNQTKNGKYFSNKCFY